LETVSGKAVGRGMGRVIGWLAAHTHDPLRPYQHCKSVTFTQQLSCVTMIMSQFAGRKSREKVKPS